MKNIESKALKAGLKLARVKDYKSITRRDIANELGVSASLITWHFRSMSMFRSALILYAYLNDDSNIVGQAVIDRAPELEGAGAIERGKLKKLIEQFVNERVLKNGHY